MGSSRISRAFRTSLLVMGLVLTASQVFASTALTVTWDPNTETDLAGYKLRWRVLGTEAFTEVDTGLVTTFKLEGLPDYVRIEVSGAAYDTFGQQSEWSASVVTPPVPQTVGKLKVIRIELVPVR